VRVRPEDFTDLWGPLSALRGAPLSEPADIAVFRLAEAARRDVKVVLSGEGSDELFAGYERYGHYLFNSRWMSRYRHAPSGLRAWVRSQIASSTLLSASLRRKASHTFLGREDTFESLQLDNFYCAFSAAGQRRLLSGSLPVDSAYANFLGYWNTHAEAALLPRMLYADQKTYLAQLLMKQDRMSMACSLESRVPFLDHTFVEFAARVPASLKIRGGVSKYILKRAVEDLLPREIVYRKKMGFPTPLRQWLREGCAAPVLELLRGNDGILAAYMNQGELRQLLERHEKGLEDATDGIWRLINLQLWGDLFITGKRGRWAEGLVSADGVAATRP
jgi:asparagine synthase (glutamine-hydrolysing)